MERLCFLTHEDEEGIEHELKVIYLPSYQFVNEGGFYQPEYLHIELKSVTENEVPVIFKPSEIEQIKTACREHFTDDDWEYAD